MHQYLPAIGFESIQTKTQLYALLADVEHDFTHHELVSQEEGLDYCTFCKDYGENLGVAIVGDMDTNECFKKLYYFPYLSGSGITSYADVILEERMDGDDFLGICADDKVGFNLVFHLQNPTTYLKELALSSSAVKNSSVTLAGLCNEGTILLPVKKDPQQEKKQQKESRDREVLMSAARAGDPAAIESLTLGDLDTYSKVSKRLVSEDVFSIVDTYIMPQGMDCEEYSILGTILDLEKVQNEGSGVALYILHLDVNELHFDVCVPVDHVEGEPAVGRRFRGDIWLQGTVHF